MHEVPITRGRPYHQVDKEIGRKRGIAECFVDAEPTAEMIRLAPHLMPQLANAGTCIIDHLKRRKNCREQIRRQKDGCGCPFRYGCCGRNEGVGSSDTRCERYDEGLCNEFRRQRRDARGDGDAAAWCLDVEESPEV